jgi:hypothetical protein
MCLIVCGEAESSIPYFGEERILQNVVKCSIFGRELPRRRR